jgi:hypothetical protein
MKLLLLTSLLMMSVVASSQRNDFFLLKHSGRTIQSFFQGSFISLQARDGEYYSGFIKKIANDSVWIEQREVIKGYTAFAGAILDTMTFEARRISVSDIASIHKEKQRLEQTAPSILLKLGSAGYISLHVINALILHQSASFKKIGIAAAIYLAAVMVNAVHKENYYIGKKFSLQYVSLAAK